MLLGGLDDQPAQNAVFMGGGARFGVCFDDSLRELVPLPARPEGGGEFLLRVLLQCLDAVFVCDFVYLHVEQKGRFAAAAAVVVDAV